LGRATRDDGLSPFHTVV